MKHFKNIYIILIILVFTEISFSQESNLSLGPLYFKSYSGELELNSYYRLQRLISGIIENDVNRLEFQGRLNLNLNTYIIHPNFLDIKLQGQYNPGTNKTKYIGIPDVSDNSTAESIGFKATIFKTRLVSVNSFYRYSHIYQMKENFSNYETQNKAWGAIINVKTKYFPFSVSYSENKNSLIGLEDGRFNNLDQKRLILSSTNSFTEKDKTIISYSLSDYSNYLNSSKIKNIISIFRLNNNYWFDKRDKYLSRFVITQTNKTGSIKYNKLSINESLVIKLPYRFKYDINYNINIIGENSNNLTKNVIANTLSHKLFESLDSKIYYKYRNFNHSLFETKQNNVGVSFIYTKKIPYGILNIGYSYNNINNNRKSKSTDNQIYNEEHQLSDGQVVILTQPNAIIESVIVTDVTETIIYRENIDYVLFDRGGFIEIQRVIGGQIIDNELVYIDYIVSDQVSYNYTGINNDIRISVSLFEKFVDIYYQYTNNDFKIFEKIENLPLRYIKKNVYGLRIKYKFLGSGIEFTNFNSNVVPYEQWMIYINASKGLRKIRFSVNGNYIDHLLYTDNSRAKYIRLSAKIEYKPIRNLDLGFFIAKNEQKQYYLSTDFYTAKIDITYKFNQLYMSGGIDYYQRNYQNSQYNLTNTFIKLIRKF